ncbi:NYN domain-containing protein [Desulfonatronum parangueonense]
MIRKIVSIDLLPAEMRAKEYGFEWFPIDDFVHALDERNNVDVLEILVPLVRRVPDDDSAESFMQVAQNFERKKYALQMSGATVIESPAKRTSGDVGEWYYKQSDDQRLIIATLSLCLRLNPDFLILVAADGDYAPMVEELRRQGIRTEVAAPPHMLASDLRRVAWRNHNLDDVFKKIKKLNAVMK